MRKHYRLPDDLRQKVKELRAEGLSYSQIGLKLDISRSVAQKFGRDIDRPLPKKENKRYWPEWKEWALLHERYGGKA